MSMTFDTCMSSPLCIVSGFSLIKHVTLSYVSTVSCIMADTKCEPDSIKNSESSKRKIGCVTKINIFPIKSCRAVSLSSASTTFSGLASVTQSLIKDR